MAKWREPDKKQAPIQETRGRPPDVEASVQESQRSDKKIVGFGRHGERRVLSSPKGTDTAKGQTYVEARKVLAVADNDVNELVAVVVVAEDDLAVVDLCVHVRYV